MISQVLLGNLGANLIHPPSYVQTSSCRKEVVCGGWSHGHPLLALPQERDHVVEAVLVRALAARLDVPDAPGRPARLLLNRRARVP